MTLALVCGIVAPGYALDLDLSDATIDASEGGLHVEKIEAPFHFVKEESLAPGTTITRSYIIQNTHDYHYSLHLRAENPKNTPVDVDLVNMIDLTLTLDGVEVYSGKVGGGVDAHGHTMENDIYLGIMEKLGSHKLTATFSLPGPELTNEFQGARAEVDWVFSASRAPDEPEGPGTPDGPKYPGYAPKTGDTIRLGIMVFVSLVLALLVVYAKRQSEDGKGRHVGKTKR